MAEVLDIKEVKTVPKLRFKEYGDQWRNTRIGNLGYFKGGGTPPTENKEYWKGPTPWISSSDVNESDVFNLNITRYISDKAISDSATKIIPANSVLFVSRVGVGKLAVNKEPLCTSQDFANLMLYKDESFFIAYYFLAKNKLLHQYSQGTSIKGFTSGDLKSIPINLPTLPEQQKIASFLSAVDQKIQQLTKKKELLEQYKKGVMQKLFSQELRFKPARPAGGNDNGDEYPDWEENRLGEIATFLKGKGISKSDIVDNGRYPCIRYGELYTIYNETIDNVFSSTNLNEKELIMSEKGDVIIPSSGETNIDIAKASCVLKKGIALGGDLNIFRGHFNGVFLSYYLNNAYRQEIAKLAQGNSVVHLYSSQLKNLKMLMPSLIEQQKIANYLSAIDTQIETINQQITQTKTFKKGLLQQMFV